MFNLNKFDTQKKIWDEPSLIDEVVDTKNYYGLFPFFWYPFRFPFYASNRLL